MRYLYSFIFYLITPFLFLRLLWRSIKIPGYRKRWKERLGFSPSFERSIWIHAVSVGETIAAIPLIKTLKTKYPHIPIIVTNMTPTGASRVTATFGDSVTQLYVPYDLPDVMHRFLKKIKPKLLIVMETELWPNLFASCKRKNIPIIVTNARLSAKSAYGYGKIRRLTKSMLNAVTVLAAQGKADAERFVELGLNKNKIHVTGNLKFDLEVPDQIHQRKENFKKEFGERLIWIAASTHPTEEEIIFAAHQKIREIFPTALLILAPRHPHRSEALGQLAKRQGLETAFYSQTKQDLSSINVYIIDTIGELLLFYSLCDVAFVGGSFASIGGHNMLEPAIFGKPVLSGSHVFNFTEISNMLCNATGMQIVHNDEELANEVISLFKNPESRQTMGNHALDVLKTNRGALNKQLDLINSYLKQC